MLCLNQDLWIAKSWLSRVRGKERGEAAFPHSTLVTADAIMRAISSQLVRGI